jgi:hypothetical protein
MAMGLTAQFRLQSITVFILTRTVRWRDLLFYPHPLPLSQKERGVVPWQYGSATRREGALRNRDSFVNCPGAGIARTRNSHSPNRTIIISSLIFYTPARRHDDF